MPEKYTCKLNTFKLHKIKNKEKNTLKEVTGGKKTPLSQRGKNLQELYLTSMEPCKQDESGVKYLKFF